MPPDEPSTSLPDVPELIPEGIPPTSNGVPPGAFQTPQRRKPKVEPPPDKSPDSSGPELFRKFLEEHGMTAKRAGALGITLERTEDHQGPGIKAQTVHSARIPYFEPTAKRRAVVDKVDGASLEYARLRELGARQGFGASTTAGRKYQNRAGTSPHTYFTPGVPWPKLLKSTSEPLIIVEGELKAALLCSHGLPAIALGGVDAFSSARLGVKLLDELAAIVWEGRTVTVCFDSDVQTNPDVARAERRLAKELTSRGAEVRAMRLPALTPGAKCGADDYILGKGLGAFRVLQEAATKVDTDSEEMLALPVRGSVFLNEPTPDPEWLVPNLILKGALHFFVGLPSSGKTALTLHATVQMACKGARILLVEQEGSKFALQHKLRMDGLTTPELQDRIGFLYRTGIDLQAGRWREHFESLLRDYDVVLLDPLADVQSNSTLEVQDIGLWLKWLRDALALHETTGIVNVHSPKGTSTQERKPSLADIFGSAVQGAKIDVCFVCRDMKDRKAKPKAGQPPPDDDQEAEHTPFKELWCVKLREHEPLAVQMGRVDAVAVPGRADVHGRPATVGLWRFTGESLTSTKSRVMFEKHAPRIIAWWNALETPPRTIDAAHTAYQRTGASPHRSIFYTVVSRLLEDSLLILDVSASSSAPRRSAARKPRKKGVKF